MEDVAFQALCRERHKQVESTFTAQGKRLDNHGDRLDKLENNEARTDTIVKNLCDQIKALTTALWWAMGLMITTGLAFIIWYIQSIPR